MKLTIGTRMMLGFGVVVALALALGLYALSTMAELRKIESTIADRDLKVQELLRQIAINQGKMRGLREMATKRALTGTARRALTEVCGYLEQNLPRMHYDEYLAAQQSRSLLLVCGLR